MEYIIKFYDKSILPKELYVPSVIDDNLLSEYFNIKVSVISSVIFILFIKLVFISSYNSIQNWLLIYDKRII